MVAIKYFEEQTDDDKGVWQSSNSAVKVYTLGTPIYSHHTKLISDPGTFVAIHSHSQPRRDPCINISADKRVGFYLGNFPYSYDVVSLAHLIRSFAIPKLVKFICYGKKKKSKGYAFVFVNDTETRDFAIQSLDGMVLGNRVLVADLIEHEEQLHPIMKKLFGATEVAAT